MWKKRDQFVLLWLKSTLTERALSLISRCASTHEAWDALSRNFQAQTKARQLALKRQLQTLSKGSSSIMEYLDRKRSIVDSLAQCGSSVDDDDLMSYILHGLDASYGPFITAFMMHAGSASVDDLVGLLLQEEERLEEEHRRFTSAPSANLVQSRFGTGRSSHPVSGGPSQSPNSHSDSGMRSSSMAKPKISCQICKRTGHEAINCFNRFNGTDFPSTFRRSSRASHSANIASPSALTDPAWYVDSGASDHVTNDLSKLRVSSDYNGADGLTIGNGPPGTSASQGTS